MEEEEEKEELRRFNVGRVLVINSPPALAIWNLFIMLLSRITHARKQLWISSVASASLMSSVCFSRKSGRAFM